MQRYAILGFLVMALTACGPATPTPESGARVPGGSVADFSLESAGEGPLQGQITLSKELAEGPVVLVFYRGNWCSTCMDQLDALEGYVGEFEQRGASLVAVSSDSQSQTEAMITSQNLSYAVLSDEELAVIEAYGVRDGVADHSYPATFIILPDGTVVYREIATGPEGGHPDVNEILEALDASKDE